MTEIDFSKIKTYSLAGRHNLVTLANLARPGSYAGPCWSPPELLELVQRLAKARQKGRAIIWSLGAHVIKNGLSPYLIDLMQRGWITHLAGNGAVSIHDFELALAGGTSEHVPTAIEDGSFGMWEETGRYMNEAIQQGWARGLGYGAAVADYMARQPQLFPHKKISVLYQASQLGVSTSFHIALGTDIIHQHPTVDFAATGGASGRDFKKMCQAVADLEGGVFLNFGSSVIGPEVFLKALSIVRNLGHQVFTFTTANFDLVELGDYRSSISSADPLYYYRPRKNIVNRPVSRGGKGFHFTVDHQVSIPNLAQLLAGKEK